MQLAAAIPSAAKEILGDVPGLEDEDYYIEEDPEIPEGPAPISDISDILSSFAELGFHIEG
jgi:hypothetical protein